MKAIEKEWFNLSDEEKQKCLRAMASTYGLDWTQPRHLSTLRRIFDLSSPKMVLEYVDEETILMVSIHEESQGVVKQIAKIYL
jgi:hypothetical protein